MRVSVPWLWFGGELIFCYLWRGGFDYIGPGRPKIPLILGLTYGELCTRVGSFWKFCMGGK